MEFIPTNDVFKNLIVLLRLHKTKGLIIEVFESQGLDVSQSQIKSWSTPTGVKSRNYRPMPQKHLEAFMLGLHDLKLIDYED